jgi:polyisoprenoid-binding protein YceI
VHASDLLNGDHSITFSRFRGVAELDTSGHGRFRLDVDMTTLRAENDFITDFAKYELLDVGTYPRAQIHAQVEPIANEPDTFLLTGNVVLHGVERGIRFRATFVRRGEHIDIHAVFKMSRAEFAMHAREADWIIQDDLRITLDLYAGPEQVTIESLP